MSLKLNTEMIITSSEISRNYGAVRKKISEEGMVVVFKNNKPDIVAMSVEEYKRLNEKANKNNSL